MGTIESKEIKRLKGIIRMQEADMRIMELENVQDAVALNWGFGMTMHQTLQGMGRLDLLEWVEESFNCDAAEFGRSLHGLDAEQQ